MSDIDQGPCVECRCRRPGWTDGSRVKLADGQWWSLPEIDATTLITTPRLTRDINEALQIAQLARQEVEASEAQLLRCIRYHMHIKNVCGRLLRANYDLPDQLWQTLFAFDDLMGVIYLSVEVSRTLAQACQHHHCYMTLPIDQDIEGTLRN